MRSFQTAWLLPLAATAGLVAGCRSGSEPAPSGGSGAGASASAQPSASSPAKPVAEKPAAEKPAAEKPAAEKPAAEKPAAEKPAAEKPVAAPAEKAPMANGKLLAEVGKLAPDFELKDLDGRTHTLSQYRGKYVVLEWFSPGCPACKYAYSQGPFTTMPERYAKEGMVWLTVNSEAPENDAASPEMNRKFVETYKMQVPILFDSKGHVGRSYGAKSTPHMFVIDPGGTLVYKGAIDNAPGGQVEKGKTAVNYVDAAIADHKAGRKVATPETTSYG